MNILDAHVKDIKELGFTVLRNAVSKDEVSEILNFIRNFEYAPDELMSIKKFGMRLNNYADNVYNVVTKRPDYLNYFIEGLVGDVLRHFLNDEYYKSIPAELPNYIIRSMLARSSKEEMPYHIDSFIPYGGDYVSVMQASIFLEKSDRLRGCTTVIPRSHLSAKYAPQEQAAPEYVECEAGDVAIWDSRLWHATARNQTDNTRWALIGTFCRWYIKQGFDYPKAISDEIFKNLSVQSKIVLGYASTVPFNEFEKTEIKGSLEQLNLIKK
jgi:hypothetical protein